MEAVFLGAVAGALVKDVNGDSFSEIRLLT